MAGIRVEHQRTVRESVARCEVSRARRHEARAVIETVRRRAHHARRASRALEDEHHVEIARARLAQRDRGVGDDVFGDQIGRQGKALERGEPIETVDRYPRLGESKVDGDAPSALLVGTLRAPERDTTARRAKWNSTDLPRTQGRVVPDTSIPSPSWP